LNVSGPSDNASAVRQPVDFALLSKVGESVAEN
jgi:hypothetical protein